MAAGIEPLARSGSRKVKSRCNSAGEIEIRNLCRGRSSIGIKVALA
jgi:hypothetical protein